MFQLMELNLMPFGYPLIDSYFWPTLKWAENYNRIHKWAVLLDLISRCITCKI